VGKTTVISTLADWYAEHKVPVELLDFDDENKANSGLIHFQKSARKIHVDKRDGLDVFIEIVDKTTHPVIVADFGARSGRLTFNWFDSTFEHLKGLDITFTAVGVVTTDPGSVTSVLEWADHLQKKVQYLIVLNELQTEQAVFDVWEKSEQVARFRADLKPKVIRFLPLFWRWRRRRSRFPNWLARAGESAPNRFIRPPARNLPKSKTCSCDQL
jgi:hypothetical protein